MTSHLEQTIRERAYQLWTESGCQDGNAEVHWLEAQRQVLAASLGAVARVIDTQSPTAQKTQKHTSRKKRRAA